MFLGFSQLNADLCWWAPERFLVDAHDDGIWLGKIGVNAECMRALWCALKGCDLHGVPRRMLNIVDLRHRQNLVALAQVDVSESDIRDEGLECLVAAVLQMKVELVVLKAVKANLGPRAGGILRRLLEDDNDLEELCIGRNNLGGAGMAPLCKGIRNHPNLNLLDVSANEIDAPGGEEIGALLTTCSNLTELDCSWNNLTGFAQMQIYIRVHSHAHTRAHTALQTQTVIHHSAQEKMVHLCCRAWQ